MEGNPTKKTEDGRSEQTVNNPVAILDPKTGRIEFLYCVNYSRCFSMRSLDDGLTWSQPVEITSSFEPFRSQYDWNVIATGPGHGIALESGRLVVPIWLAYGKSGAHAPSATGTITSDDSGKSWQAGDIVVPNKSPYINPNASRGSGYHGHSISLATESQDCVDQSQWSQRLVRASIRRKSLGTNLHG
jgi:sialidase-1